MPKLNRCDTPPPPGPRYRIRRLRHGESMQFILLGPMCGLYTHWTGSRTEPCYENKKDCAGCRTGKPKRWKGYVHVWNEAIPGEEFLEFTPTAAALLNDLLGDAAELRGNRLMMERGGGDKSRLKLSLLCHYEKLRSNHPLPQTRDPLETLSRLWNDPNLKDDRDNGDDKPRLAV